MPGLHQIGEHSGDKDEEKWRGGQKKTLASQVRVSHSEGQEKKRNQKRSSIAEV